MSRRPSHSTLRSRLSPGKIAVLAAIFFVLGGAGLYVLLRAGGPLVAPAPGPDGDPPHLAELPSSALHLPVVSGVEGLAQMLEPVVPPRFGDLADRRSHPSAREIEYAFEAEREPLEIEMRGDTFHVTTVLHYRARGWVQAPFLGMVTGGCGGSGDARPRARVVLASPLDVDEEWRLRTDLRVERVEPLTEQPRDRCTVSDLGVDFTEGIMVGARAALDEWTDRIDAEVSSLDVRSELERYWALLQEPMPLAEDLWLVLEPTAVERGRVTRGDGEGHTVRAAFTLQTRPRIVSGSRPRASTAALPALRRGEPEEVSRVLVEARAGYDLVSDLARRNLVGRTFEVGGRSVRIQGVEASGLGDGRLVLRLDVEGPLAGRLFLVGTPVYDAEREEVAVPDLTFHVETRNLLARAGSWILEQGFSERLRRSARWPISALVRDAGGSGDVVLDRPLADGVRLEGRLGSLEVTRVVALRDALVVRSRLDGRLRVLVESAAEEGAAEAEEGVRERAGTAGPCDPR